MGGAQICGIGEIIALKLCACVRACVIHALDRAATVIGSFQSV
jgi:hypothetical protein